jgi:di/tricarboxylate transporter
MVGLLWILVFIPPRFLLLYPHLFILHSSRRTTAPTTTQKNLRANGYLMRPIFIRECIFFLSHSLAGHQHHLLGK